jgi:hypothetical protein
MPVIEAQISPFRYQDYQVIQNSFPIPFPVRTFMSWIVTVGQTSPSRRSSYYSRVREADKRGDYSSLGDVCSSDSKARRRPGSAKKNVAHFLEHLAINVYLRDYQGKLPSIAGRTMRYCSSLRRGQLVVSLASSDYQASALVKAFEEAVRNTDEHFARPPRVRARRRL